MQKECDNLRHECDRLQCERDAIQLERDTLLREKEELQAELNNRNDIIHHLQDHVVSDIFAARQAYAELSEPTLYCLVSRQLIVSERLNSRDTDVPFMMYHTKSLRW